MKYLLIDGNNLGCRCAFANQNLRTTTNFSTSVHFGFFQSLLTLKKKFSDRQFLIAWDSKSKRRMQESIKAKESGLVPEAYKENRSKKEQPQAMKDFLEQSPVLKRALEYTGIPQVCYEGYEADDVIASYAFALGSNSDNDVLILTSDADYNQLLTNNVSIYDGMKMLLKTKDTFIAENSITPEQFVDVGALMGDDSDNIFGVPGCGDTKAFAKIREFGTYNGVIDDANKKMEIFRSKYPDLNTLSDGEIKFKELSEAKTEKGTIKWKGISYSMPYTGVAYAFENGEKIKIQKLDLMIAMFAARIALAYSLKKMDMVKEALAEPIQSKADGEKLEEYMRFFEMSSFLQEIYVFDPKYVSKDVGAFVPVEGKKDGLFFNEKDLLDNNNQWDLPF